MNVSDIHRRWEHYLCEFLGTTIMVGFGLFFIALFWSSDSPLSSTIHHLGLRRLVTGLFFAGGATLVVYSPLGEKSGGHINPSVTLGFLLLKKISYSDAIFYIVSQLLGGIVGAGLSFFILTQMLGWTDAILVGSTHPGLGYSPIFVCLTEFVMTAILMLSILIVSNRRRWMHLTPLAAGVVVVLEVWMAAHISGTSLNLARSLGPAIFSHHWHHFWIYILAPIGGALSGAMLFRIKTKEIICAKLFHTKKFPCHMLNCSFCKKP